MHGFKRRPPFKIRKLGNQWLLLATGGDVA